MSNILIVYGSTTGNTAFMAERIKDTLAGAGHAVTARDVADVTAQDLCADYDVCLFGSSTWGDEDIELQDDFADFLPDIGKTAVAGKKTGVFGCGDTSYTHFCGAVDVITAELTSAGAEPVVDGLKIDGDPRAETGDIDDWAKDVLKAVA